MHRVIPKFAPDDPDAALVIPGVMFRLAELTGTRGKWDGIYRKVVLDGALVGNAEVRMVEYLSHRSL